MERHSPLLYRESLFFYLSSHKLLHPLIIHSELINRWPHLAKSPHTGLCYALRWAIAQGSGSTSVNANWKCDPPAGTAERQNSSQSVMTLDSET